MQNAKMLRQSFIKASAEGDSFAADFYDNLFALAPEVRALFPDDMGQQQYKLLLSLSTIFEGLENDRLLQPYLLNLGRQHIGYGTKDEHYAKLGLALLQTLEDRLGDEWTPQLKQAWVEAYAYIAQSMRPTEL